MVREGKKAEGREYRAGVPFPMPGGLKTDFPQVEISAAILGDGGIQVLIPGADEHTEKKFIEEGVFITEPPFFKMFDFKILSGDPLSAIAEPSTVLLTKLTAEKYFSNWKLSVGKTINIYNQMMKVTGILDNPPVNSDFQMKIVVSYATLKKQLNLSDWTSISDANYCFIQLVPGYQPKKLNAMLPAFLNKYLPSERTGYNLRLQPLAEMHHDERFGNFSGRTFSTDLITALTLIGLFMIIIACINFINMSTAQAIIRAKEVGVRKVLGGSRKQLLLQFFGETGMACSIAFVLAFIIAVLALPFLNALLDTKLTIHLTHNPGLLLFMPGLLVVVTFLAGFYPALVLSGFNPINAFKSKIMGQSSTDVSLRRGLVVVQFAIAQVLIIGTLVVVSQMEYFKNADTGFNKTAVINASFPVDSLSRTKMEVLRNQLLSQAGVKGVSFSLAPPTNGGRSYTDMQTGIDKKDRSNIVVNIEPADPAYFDIYKLQLTAGRIYFPSDTIKEFVVDETLLQKSGLGKSKDVIAKRITVNGVLAPIVGVVKDFHVNSLRDPIDAIVLTTIKNAYSTANIQLQPTKIKEAIEAIKNIWNKTYPDYVFDFHFVDQSIADYYKQENQLSNLYKIFSGIAIFISCLGLYGLISFMAIKRNKEIGIRKVLGASVLNILLLLSRELTVLILLSFIIACPIAWYFMNQWLHQYTFRIDLGIGFFVMTFLSSILLAWLTVGYSAISAAMTSPVKSLKTE